MLLSICYRGRVYVTSAMFNTLYRYQEDLPNPDYQDLTDTQILEDNRFDFFSEIACVYAGTLATTHLH